DRRRRPGRPVQSRGRAGAAVVVRGLWAAGPRGDGMWSTGGVLERGAAAGSGRRRGRAPATARPARLGGGHPDRADPTTPRGSTACARAGASAGVLVGTDGAGHARRLSRGAAGVSRLLFLLPSVPDPPDAGARLRNMALLRLTAEQHTVDAIAFGE